MGAGQRTEKTKDRQEAFYVVRQMQKHGWNKVDVEYWNDKGWTKKNRPWRKAGG